MMVNNIWFNLASQDLDKSKKFYQNIGFEIMERPEQEGKMFGIKAKKRLSDNDCSHEIL
ncbi:hypothetical protein [Staphylococcus sp. HMSC056G08]|uniref:hypothetical protein n=1 Tax=Staphylococcus sp. HMSC056G08 TaxID=1739350 RepID=UPI0021086F39|nr:hypothetical protein [Staphylococcus sp. HMSC056G08]